MKTLNLKKLVSSIGAVMVVTIASFSYPGSSTSYAQAPSAFIDLIRVMKSVDTGIRRPSGLTFSSRLNSFYVVNAPRAGGSGAGTDLIQLTTTENRAGSDHLLAAVEDPINMAVDNRGDRLLILQGRAAQLVELTADQFGNLSPDRIVYHDIASFGVKDPQGMAVDPGDGDLFILDAARAVLVHVVPGQEAGFEDATVSRLDLKAAGSSALRGIAIDPLTSHIHVLSPAAKKLYEFTQSGQLVAYRDLADFQLKSPQAITFAPSGDQTDDPLRMNLYLADSGQAVERDERSTGQILEFSFVMAASLPSGTTLLPASLVHIIDTSKAAWSPSSPDPAGLDYWPLTGTLLVSDSEVDEMSIYFTGKNVFQSRLSGNLVSTCSTTSFSHEPTGVAINPGNNHIFFSDDGPNDKVFEVSLGPDGTYCTADDVVNTFNVNSLYNIGDAEDVAYGNNTLFVAGGSSAEVYRIPLGADGVMGGGNDGPMTHFDTAGWGFNDLEGIEFNELDGTLFIVSTKKTDKYLGETSVSGSLLQAYDLSLMGDAGNIRSDVSYAPGSQNPNIYSIYICSRGIDNDSNSKENDGRIWEISIGTSGGTTPTPTPTSTAPTPTPTATETPPSSDLIFADSFESGNFSAWSASRTDSGDLSVNPAAALQGSQGMQVLIDDINTIYVTDTSPVSEPRYRARFYLDPNSISMADGSSHFILDGLMGTTPVLRVQFRRYAGDYQVRVRSLDDGGTWRSTGWSTISDAPQAVELDWRAATSAGANDGGLTLWINGAQQANLSTIDNDTRRIDTVRLGATAAIDSTTIGAFYLDAFESCRQGYIGP